LEGRERDRIIRGFLSAFFSSKRDIFPDIFRRRKCCALWGKLGHPVKKATNRDQKKKFKKHFTLSRPWVREKLFIS